MKFSDLDLYLYGFSSSDELPQCTLSAMRRLERNGHFYRFKKYGGPSHDPDHAAPVISPTNARAVAMTAWPSDADSFLRDIYSSSYVLEIDGEFTTSGGECMELVLRCVSAHYGGFDGPYFEIAIRIQDETYRREDLPSELVAQRPSRATAHVAPQFCGANRAKSLAILELAICVSGIFDEQPAQRFPYLNLSLEGHWATSAHMVFHENVAELSQDFLRSYLVSTTGANIERMLPTCTMGDIARLESLSNPKSDSNVEPLPFSGLIVEQLRQRTAADWRRRVQGLAESLPDIAWMLGNDNSVLMCAPLPGTLANAYRQLADLELLEDARLPRP